MSSNIKEIPCYDLIRNEMKTGDVIATADNNWTSKMIRWATKSSTSHVGMVYKTGHFIEILETVKTGWNTARVGVTRLSNLITPNKGERIWWLQLLPEYRESLNQEKMLACLREQKGKHYDFWQAFGSIMPWKNSNDAGKLFCSEAVGQALTEGNILPYNYNYSEATPKDIISLGIYECPVQISGVSTVLY